ncbi:MAG: cupin domain-containing protein [Chloroflexi bacterium]|nr:MAG: cupin domain-containing protein [Chloroflexota bacterium]
MSGPFVSWDAAPSVQVSPGDVVRVVTGDGLQVIRSEVQPGVEFEVHGHPEEQMIVVLGGALRFRVGDVESVARAGDVVHVPSGVPHGGRVEGDRPLVAIEIFQPPRTEIGHGSNRARIADH